jgi:hypothetical protein
MDNRRTVYVACWLSRSAFSGERVFRATCSDGSEHVGVAPTHYCSTSDGHPVGADAPPKGKRIKGFVKGVSVENGGVEVAVALPDGNTIWVSRDQLESEGVRHVPVGS